MERLLLILCFVGLNSGLLAQEYAVDEGASFLAGMGSFSSQGGDLFLGASEDRIITITLLPSFNYFVFNNFFVGGSVALSRQSQGNTTTTTIGIGPQIGFTVGGENSTAFPYLTGGLRYYSFNTSTGNSSFTANGTDLVIGFGVLTAIRSHLGLVVEGGYHILNLKSKDPYTGFTGATVPVGTTHSGNVISIALGVVGLLH